MKKYLALAAILLLVGAGCANIPDGPSATGTSDVPGRGDEQKSATATEREKGQQGEEQKSATATEREKGQQGDEQKSATATDKETERANAAVVVTSGGIAPAAITVKKGTTVTWTNRSGKPVRIASNPHPTHTDYPGFDSKEPIDQGETYSFTFDKIGSWVYHDHFSPSVGGTVVVE